MEHMACACLDAQMVSDLTLWSSSLSLCVFCGLNSDCQAHTGSPFICGTILQTWHTGKVILSQEYSTTRLSRILHTFYFPTCIVRYSSPFRCSFLFSMLYHTAAVNVINYNAMRTLIRFCVCPGTGRGSVCRCPCSLISTNPSPSSKCQSYIRTANSGD